MAALLALGAGCAASPGTPAGPGARSASPAGVTAALVADLEGQLAPTPDRGELHALATELVVDWQREAGDDADAPAVMALLRRELADQLAALRGRPFEVQLELVRAEVLARRVRGLGRRSLLLGKAVIDGAIPDPEARTAGEQLTREVAALAPRIRALRDPERARALASELAEVSLEATYAVARGAMSPRLGAYQASRAAAPDAR